MTVAKPAALDAREVPVHAGTDYPAPYDAAVMAREKRALGDAFGLGQFGVNLVRLPPGCWSSQRHWHGREDEFLYVLEGEPTLLTDAGEQLLRPGMVAGFPAGRADGHHLINNTDADVFYLEVGTRDPQDECHYPDIDLAFKLIAGAPAYVHADGTPYRE